MVTNDEREERQSVGRLDTLAAFGLAEQKGSSQV